MIIQTSSNGWLPLVEEHQMIQSLDQWLLMNQCMEWWKIFLHEKHHVRSLCCNKITRPLSIAFFYPAQSKYDGPLVFRDYLQTNTLPRRHLWLIIMHNIPSPRRTLRRGKIRWSVKLRQRLVVQRKALKTPKSLRFHHLQFDQQLKWSGVANGSVQSLSYLLIADFSPVWPRYLLQLL